MSKKASTFRATLSESPSWKIQSNERARSDVVFSNSSGKFTVSLVNLFGHDRARSFPAFTNKKRA